MLNTKELVGEAICGIEIESEFPNRIDSPDPIAVIETLVDTGTFAATASKVGCGETTLQDWARKYPEIREAYEQGKDSIGYEAEYHLVDMMRQGTDKDPQGRDEQHSDRYRAALKIATTCHPSRDYSSRERRVVEDKRSKPASNGSLQNMEGMSAEEAIREFDEMFSSNGDHE